MISEQHPGRIKARFNAIPIYALIFAGILLCAGQMKNLTMTPETPTSTFDFTKRTSSAPIPLVQRGLKEIDKPPIIQWIERTRIDHNISSKHVVLIAQTNANEPLFTTELTQFLKQEGYSVSMADTLANRTKRNLSFEGRQNEVLVYIGQVR